MISKRLKTIADFVPNKSFVLDVGCDHALLDIYLVLNKDVKCVASDIASGPLEFAKKNVLKYKLSDKIKIEQADGIANLTDNIDTIVLSGMGCSTILKILNDGKDKLNNIKHIIISPNNDYYGLRLGLIKLGFRINNEEFILDKKKYYLVIDFVPGVKKYSKIELYFGPILSKSNNKIYKEYLLIQKDKLCNINRNLGFKNILLKLKNNNIIQNINKIIK